MPPLIRPHVTAREIRNPTNLFDINAAGQAAGIQGIAGHFHLRVDRRRSFLDDAVHPAKPIRKMLRIEIAPIVIGTMFPGRLALTLRHGDFVKAGVGGPINTVESGRCCRAGS